jgi:hypothetical protein
MADPTRNGSGTGQFNLVTISDCETAGSHLCERFKLMKFKMLACGLAMWTVGYWTGTRSFPEVSTLNAQESDSGLSTETATKVQAASESIKAAMDALQQDGKYEGLSETPNAFLVLSGGGNAMEDLTSGQGVDPESFAALYSGQVKQEVRLALSSDDQGRLLYNDQLIRLYSKTRLEKMFSERAKLSLSGSGKSSAGGVEK